MFQNSSQTNNSTLFLSGTKYGPTETRNSNVLAALSLANIIKSSLGPVGLDKMLVDSMGDFTMTNDGATILSLVDVEHPAGKILVELAQQQDREVGDGTTSVVIIASELLRRANELIGGMGLHPSIVINGYRLALNEAIRYIENNMQFKVEDLGKDVLVNIAKTSMSSKIIGSDDEFFANLVVDSILKVKTTNGKGEVKYPVKAINLLKAHGKSSLESILVDGYALNCTVASQAMPKKLGSFENPNSSIKVACLDINLQKARMAMGVKIEITDPEQLEKIREREQTLVLERCQKIIDAGAQVILTTKGIDDLCLKTFVENGCMAVRRCLKEDLKRIAKATGATMITSLSNLEGDEVFEKESLGSCREVIQTKISDDECILVKGTAKHSSSSIVLRGPNDYSLDEMERSVHDSLCVVKRTLESGYIVCGGGCVETGLNIYLDNFATSVGSREQLAISEFANSLLVIPKTLAINAAKDSSDLIAKLRSYHAISQSNLEKKKYKNYGLDLLNGKIVDELKKGVIEPSMSKIKSLKSAVEACIAILRIDTTINVDPEPEREDPHDH